ncbi:MAG: NAD(P)H-dependent oxidoreductase [Candidatus Eremiobacterota bacterium]
MITLRPAHERGLTRLPWLDSRHTFSFGAYHDPRHMTFRALRVLNDDRIAASGGFPMHPHRDMEIVTCVLSGAIQHRDSLGNGSVVPAGQIQRMTAGTGIRHSEFNPSREEPVHLLQIWIQPERPGLVPGYEQKSLPEDATGLTVVASPEGGAPGAPPPGRPDLPGQAGPLGHPLEARRHAWVQVTRGRLQVNGVPLGEGDGAAISREAALRIDAAESAEWLLFDLNQEDRMARILAFAASNREASYNRKLIRLGAEAARAAGGDVTLLDLRDYPLPLYDGDLEAREGLPENARKLKQVFFEHQGLLLATPEYNSGYPPLLKNTLDWLSRQQEGEAPLQAFSDKVAGLMAASIGGFGGLRGLLQVRTVLSYIKVHVLHQQVTVSHAANAFDEEGRLKDPGPQKQVETLARELVRITQRLHD